MKKQPIKLHYWKFNPQATTNINDEQANQIVQQWIERKYVTQNPIHKIAGWAFNLKPYLKKYIVGTQYYGIQLYYAINKTSIRKQGFAKQHDPIALAPKGF